MNKRKELFRVILAVSIIIVGITHFAVPEPYVKIMPPQLPYPLGLVYLSGFYEILGGIGLLVPPVSQAAAWRLILLFIAVFPANINMAVNHIKIETIPYSDSPWFQAVRLPFQAVFLAWAWWYTKPSDKQIQASIIPKLLIPKELDW
ncbi:DoxX family protein [Nostoc sp. FACHB-152]|uniref:DoxX family protein n=1 Tax=unclassified Nostoc TaxID=2593658 RepID=UPI0016888CB5|nr:MULTISPECIES: DoxX family protein [unclassified Nostoc]MBD2447366.1 DoxX family protein [Nostoc sp. FACHB-152]MBD2468032.1 DoxX family protein [Nostoc sp. FACHB-145]